MIIIWKIDFHLDEGSFDWNYILKKCNDFSLTQVTT